jgi:hypothetical protein
MEIGAGMTTINHWMKMSFPPACAWQTGENGNPEGFIFKNST